MFVNRQIFSWATLGGVFLGLVSGLLAMWQFAEVQSTAAFTAVSAPMSVAAAPLGPTDPAPQGYYIAYAFTGVTDNNNAATVIHCTNPTNTAAEVILELYNSDFSDDYTYSFNALPQRTYTIETREQGFFEAWETMNTSFIQQGFGRIMVEENRRVLCVAQIVQNNTNSPSITSNLDMYAPQTTTLSNNVMMAGTAPQGYELLYTFTGFMHYNNIVNSMDNISTVIHCTNMGTEAVTAWYEVDYFEGSLDTVTYERTILSGRTVTLASLPTAFFNDTDDLSDVLPTIRQGSGRIYVDSPNAILYCNVQVVDPVENLPRYLINMPLFDSFGRVLEIGAYLPYVIR